MKLARIEYTSLREEGVQLTNQELPGFIKSMVFQHEEEAQLVYSLWNTFIIGKTKEQINKSYNEFAWIIKATLRIVFPTSLWAM